MSEDVVAFWDVPLSDRVHRIEFEHGTMSGKRVIRANGKELFRKDWMFKLVGNEEFHIGRVHCIIKVEPMGAFAYSYELEVNGKTYEKFTEIQTKAMKTWIVDAGDETHRVVLEKDTLDVWANGRKLETMGEFVEDGTETHFSLGDHPAYIKAVTSGRRREGIIHNLIINNTIVPEVVE